MMTTVNISLSENQLALIDQFSKQFGFTNRSEFIRSILRLVQNQPQIVSKAALFPFAPPAIKSRQTLLKSLQKTGKYSQKFWLK